MAKKLITSLASNGLSVLSRLAAGVLIFIGLGRFLPPIEFGLFSYWVGVATIVAVIGDFGCSTRVLRDLAAAGQNATIQYANLARLRFTASLLLFVISVVLVTLFYRNEAVVALLLITTMLIATAGEYCSNALRALGMFQQESRISSINNILTAFVVIFCSQYGVTVVAATYLACRMLGFWQLSQATQAAGLNASANVSIFREVKASLSFAADSLVTVLATGFDVVIVRQIGGLSAVASYQAVSKLITGFFVFAQVFSGVFIPRIVRAENKKREIYILLLVFILFSIGFSLLLNFSARLISEDLYRARFGGIEILIFSFSFYLIVRFCASALGIFLTSVGRQQVRVVGNIISLSVTIPLAYWGGKNFGFEAIPYCLAVGSGVLIVIYAYSTARYFSLPRHKSMSA